MTPAHSVDPAVPGLATVIAQYDIGALQSVTTPDPDAAPNTLLVKTDVGRFIVVRLPEPSDDDAPLAKLLNRCLRAGLPVPRPLSTGDGHTLTNWETGAALVCRQPAGHQVFNPTLRQCDALGRFTGRLHTATRGFEPKPHAISQSLTWLTARVAEAERYLAWSESDLLRTSLERIASLMKREDVDRLPHGVLHGRLARDHVLFNEQGLTGVTGFEHAGSGSLIYDLAVAANDWCSDVTGVLDPDRTLALLQAYHRVRPLERQELWFFPVFALYAALTFWVTRLASAPPESARDPGRTRHAEALRDIVRQHTARFLYLDERLFDR